MPLAILGLGTIEWVILVSMFFGIPAIVLLLVLKSNRSSSLANDYEGLLAENQRLRAELDRLRNGGRQ
jgi:hypothetical protein